MKKIDNIPTQIVHELNDKAPIIGISKEQTFDYLFRKYFTVLCFFARSIIHHEEEAKDIVQDCFCKLWLQESTIKKKDSIKSFLYTMVRNSCITYIRKQAVITKAISYLQTSENNVEYFDEIAFAEMVRLVLIQVEELPPSRNAIVLKHYLHGMKYKDIASELSSTEKAVQMHKQRAVQQLTKKLQILNCFIA